MSEPREMVFTFIACADLKGICESIATSVDRWAGTGNANQTAADAFASEFARHCELLADNPEMGVARDDLHDGLHSSGFRTHVIFYRLRAGRLEVLRVLAAARDVQAA
jgi:plasmid stabilization system protein ParE